MKVSKRQLRRIIREEILREAGMGLEEPLGAGTSSQRRERRSGALKANEKAFGGAAPFGSGMEQADLDKEEEKLVGHT